MYHWNQRLRIVDAFIRDEYGVQDPRPWAQAHKEDPDKTSRRVARSYLKTRYHAAVA